MKVIYLSHHLLGNLHVKMDNWGRVAHASSVPGDFCKEETFEGNSFSTLLLDCQNVSLHEYESGFSPEVA